jgi:hypothetical protein
MGGSDQVSRHRKDPVEQQCDLIQQARTHVLGMAELLEANQLNRLDHQYGWGIVDDLSALEGLGPGALRDLALLLDPLNPHAAAFAERVLGPQ